MNGMNIRKLNLSGVEATEEVKMDSKCLSVMVKNLTDNDISVGIGNKTEVSIENSTTIKPNCYQIVFINANEDSGEFFDTLVVFGSGTGTVECIGILY